MRSFRRILGATLVALFAGGCSSFHGLHSARALRPHQWEVGAEVSHQSLPEIPRPLGGADPRIVFWGVDLSGSLGLGKNTQGTVRLGSSGVEGSFLFQLSPPENRWFAIANTFSARGRVVFTPTGDAFRLIDAIMTVPVEFDPHPRLALIVEPKGMLSVSTGFLDGSTSGYYPFHAGVSGGGRLRLARGWVLGAEAAWYPIPISNFLGVDRRPTTWEAAISVSWVSEVGGE